MYKVNKVWKKGVGFGRCSRAVVVAVVVVVVVVVVMMAVVVVVTVVVVVGRGKVKGIY